MAALEAALDETMKELSDGGRMSSESSCQEQSADLSSNDINAQIDRWLNLHQNDTELNLINDTTCSDSDSGGAAVSFIFCPVPQLLIRRCPAFAVRLLDDIFPESGAPSGFTSPLVRMPSRIANLADTPPTEATQEQEVSRVQQSPQPCTELASDRKIMPGQELAQRVDEPRAACLQCRPQSDDGDSAKETRATAAGFDAQMHVVVAEIMETGRQASLEVAASVAEMMRTSPRRRTGLELQSRSSSSSSGSAGSKAARVIARGPGRVPRIIPGEDYAPAAAAAAEARALQPGARPDRALQPVAVVSELQMLGDVSGDVEAAVEQTECFSTHDSIVLLSSPTSSANSSIM